MSSAATRLAQLGAVFRLETGKSFLSRRGLWIYLLALMPVLIFAGHAWQRRYERARRVNWATPGTTAEKLAQIRPGMTREELVALLPQPRTEFRRQRRGEEREVIYYSDGVTEVRVGLRNRKVAYVRRRGDCDLTEDLHIFAGVFQFFYLRLAVFFGCLFVFLNLFRGEMLDKSLHYYLLAPVRREIVVVGKYLAGVVATVAIFGLSTAMQLLLLNGHLDRQVLNDYLARGDGWQHAFGYLGVTALACAAYGALFLAVGIVLRNPLIPAAVILLWEWINGILPAMLRKLTVIHYLRSLAPVEIPVDRSVPPPLALLALNVDPAPPVVAILVLLALAVVVLAWSAWRARRLEINYGAD